MPKAKIKQPKLSKDLENVLLHIDNRIERLQKFDRSWTMDLALVELTKVKEWVVKQGTQDA